MIDFSDKIFKVNPVSNRLFPSLFVFESHEAWDWYIRGCPKGEMVVVGGIFNYITEKQKAEGIEWYEGS